MRSNLLAGITTTFALACGEAPKIDGKVTDVWGKPLEGATVQLEGVVEHTTTDAQGHFSFEVAQASSGRILAGKDGYLKNTATFEMPKEEGQPLPSPTVELYPDPQQPGFYVVNTSTFDHLEGKRIKTVGTEIKAYTGLPDVGKVRVAADVDHRFVFRSTLRSSELSRLGLQLHKLDFVSESAMPGVLGEEPVDVNLYVATDVQQFDLKALPNKNTYLITSRTRLAPGFYAFHTENLLTSDEVNALDNTPKEMQVAYPFEVK